MRHIKRIFMQPLTLVIVAMGCFALSPAGAVEYGGEKSYLFHALPYKACPVAPLPEEAKAKGVKPVSASEAKSLYDDGAFFYDARGDTDFNAGRVAGAKRVFFDQSKGEYTVLNLPEKTAVPMVFYCYGTTCADSYEAALAVKEAGYKNVYWFSAGYAAWHDRHYPVEQ